MGFFGRFHSIPILLVYLAALLGPFAIGALIVLIIQLTHTKRREKVMGNFQIPFIEAEKIFGNCGTRNFLSARNCRVCGTQQVFEQVVGQYNTRCAQCGGIILRDAKFCTTCGNQWKL